MSPFCKRMKISNVTKFSFYKEIGRTNLQLWFSLSLGGNSSSPYMCIWPTIQKLQNAALKTNLLQKKFAHWQNLILHYIHVLCHVVKFKISLSWHARIFCIQTLLIFTSIARIRYCWHNPTHHAYIYSYGSAQKKQTISAKISPHLTLFTHVK